MGGFVAGFYATEHPDTRIVSLDGFGPGMPTIGDDNDRAEFAAFQQGMRAAFWAMTEPPAEGDRSWRDAQFGMLLELFPRIGYTAPKAREMAERNLVDLGDGRFRRHPSRVLFEGGFADGGDRDVLRMYRRVRSPTLIVRCTESGAPAVLEAELDTLQATNPHVEVERLPLTHLAPEWDASARDLSLNIRKPPLPTAAVGIGAAGARSGPSAPQRRKRGHRLRRLRRR